MAPPPTRLGSNLRLAPARRVSAPAPCPSAPNTCNGEGDEGHEGDEEVVACKGSSPLLRVAALPGPSLAPARGASTL